jgi:hypothetical protein
VSRPGVYWHELVPWMRHSRISDTFVNIFSFASRPEDGTTPTGASNIGRFTSVPLRFTMTNSTEGQSAGTVGVGIKDKGRIFTYARTQNFYKISGGRLGLRWTAI